MGKKFNKLEKKIEKEYLKKARAQKELKIYSHYIYSYIHIYLYIQSMKKGRGAPATPHKASLFLLSIINAFPSPLFL